MAGRVLAPTTAPEPGVTGIHGSRFSPVDLHLHTRVSDGDDEPPRLAEACVAAGVRVAAITDHNTLAGIAPFRAAIGNRCRVLTGCEITTRWRGDEAHCLGYLIREDDPRLTARLKLVHDDELRWWREWVRRAQRIGVRLNWAQVQRRLGAGRVAYPADFVDLLLETVGDDPRFRDYRPGDHRRLAAQWCQPGQPLHVPEPWWPQLTEAIGWIHEAGGVAVLAHPSRLLDLSDVVAIQELATLRGAGLDGVEVWTTWHTPAESARLARLCTELDLLTTIGSDYHGIRIKPWAARPGWVPALPPEPFALVEALADRCPFEVAGGTARP
jgi:predicted metal-dependent phosphoesterase TrpH